MTDLAIGSLEWSGPHGLSWGGSHRGVHVGAEIGYWVHDTLAEGDRRYKVCRMGADKVVGMSDTLEAAKRLAQDNFEKSILAAFADAHGEGA